MDHILKLCAQQNVKLSLADDNLKIEFDVPPGAELVSILRENKQALLEYLRDSEKRNAEPPLLKLDPRQQSGRLSYGQKRLWVTDKLEQGSAQYNMQFAFETRGKLHRDAFVLSLQQLVERHAVLRTKFVQDAGKQVFQSAAKDIVVPVKFQDLSSLTDAKQKAVIDQTIREDEAQEFDLTEGCLLRCNLMEMSSAQHFVVLTVHHIASDGWSLRIIAKEISTIYNSQIKGEAHGLPELSIQYSDFAHWQHELQQTQLFQDSVSYWRKQLLDIPAIHNLPVTDTRQTPPLIAGKRMQFALNSQKLEALQTLAASHKVTLFMLFHAIYSVVLARYSNQDKVVLGVPTANRTKPETEALIGFFANTLVLNLEVDSNQTFDAHLANVKKAHMEAQQHQSVPFDYIVEKLNPARDGSYSPIVQLALTMDDIGDSHLDMSGLDVAPCQLTPNFARFELALNLRPTAQSLVLEFEFMEALFNASIVQRLYQSMLQVIDAVLSQPVCQIQQLPVVLVAEQDVFLSQNIKNHVDYHKQSSIEALVKNQASASPDSTALIFNGISISYRELDSQSDKIASYLVQNGVQNGDTVALSCERSENMVLAMLGILKAGAAYLPLDPSYPEARISYILQDAKVSFSLISRRVATFWNNEAGPETLQIETAIDTPAEAALPAIQSANRAAYIIYTSGSTGQPKGVVVSQQNVLNFFKGIDTRFPDKAEQCRWLAVTSMSFDISVLELLWTLSRGHTVVIQPDRPQQLPVNKPGPEANSQLHQNASEEHRQRNREQFLRSFNDNQWQPLELISDYGVTHMQCTMSYVQSWTGSENGRAALQQLTTLLIGGEPLPGKTAQDLLAHVGGEIFNMYGPTETTIWSSVSQVCNSDVTIGTPIANTQFYVLNDALQLLPKGVAGELYISGDGVALEYHNRPELNQQRFIASPFDKDSRLYRTGDIVKWRDDEQLAFVGRVDEQVKVNGYRVELSEIVYHLDSLPEVQQSLVMVNKHSDSVDQLLAFVKLHEGEQTSDTELLKKRFEGMIAQSLPVFMQPKQYFFVQQWHTTANGKIDKKAMLASIDSEQFNVENLVSPETEVEQQLAGVWAKLLDIPLQSISKNSNFFQLGGHSLLVVTMIDIINEKFSTNVRVGDVFSSLNIESVAQAIELEKAINSNVEMAGTLSDQDMEEVEF